MNNTRRTIIVSAICLILCIAMLIGTTYAWFTDSATSCSNRIVAGNLDIDLVMDKGSGYVSIGENDGDIFKESTLAKNSNETLWEPGKTQIVYLGVRNLGNLALKYSISLKITDNGLADALDYAIIDGAKKTDLADVTDWATLKGATAQTDNIGTALNGKTEATFTVAENGVLDEIINGTENETDYFALAVHMNETAGNEYMGKDISIDITVNATQYSAEEDSFDNQYDINPVTLTENYLTFTANEDNSGVTPKFNSGSYQYSTDNGKTWTDGTNDGTTTINLAKAGDKVMLKGTNCISAGVIPSPRGLLCITNPFVMTGSISADGSVTSLTDGLGIDENVTLSDYCYCGMFSNCTALTTAPQLPAKTLASHCYEEMFSGCTALTKAPQLYAKELADYCYSKMFFGCSELTTTQNKLPAETMKDNCYYEMFYNCSKLTIAPTLPAKNLATNCYMEMFAGCVKLTAAPELKAEIMAEFCYDGMFKGCSALTKAPALPATTLATCCYHSMFENCSSLTEATTLPAENLANACYFYMFRNCSSLTVGESVPPEATNSGLILTCTTTTAEDAFFDMFTSTPESGHTYYWYTTE